MRDTYFKLPLPEPPMIAGVAAQSVLTLASQVFAYGKTRHGGKLLRLDMMGSRLSFISSPSIILMNETVQTIKLSGLGWEVTIRNIPLSVARYLRNHHPQTRLLRWGKEGTRLLIDTAFTGSEDEFKRDVMYSMMLGTDPDVWDEMINYREETL